MKTYNYWWKYTGIRDFHNGGTLEAPNLPQALSQLAELESFRISGTHLKRHGTRRIQFFGRCADTSLGKSSAPLVEGIVANA